MTVYDNRLSACKSCTNPKQENNEKCVDGTPLKHIKCDNKKITGILLNKDKVIVTYDDCSYHSADISVLANIGQTNYDDSEIKQKLSEIETKLNSLEENTVIVSDLNNELFKAHSLTK